MTPATVKLLGVNDPWNEPPPPPPPPPRPKPPPPPEEVNDGILPVILVSVSVRLPVAAATSRSFPIEVTEDEVRVPRPRLVRLSTSIVVPGLGRPCDPNEPRNPKDRGVDEPAAGALVTVMSVPTPYSECSTSPWASLTPADSAVTVMTRPMPRARPTAIMTA